MKNKKRGLILSATIIGATVFSSSLLLNKEDASGIQIEQISSSELTEVKQTKTEIHGLVEVYSFQESVEISDLIAKVRIDALDEELSKPAPATIFNATVLEVFKGNGEQLDNINILQEGNSEFIFNNMELFEPGEEVILFMGQSKENPNRYWIRSGEANIYKIKEKEVVKEAWADEYLNDITTNVKEVKNTKKQYFEEDKFIKKLVKEIDKIEKEEK
ncbi:hypothetical protein V1503_18745 [Bacillus sp. SCS-151]|uniref:hypothetical protein n=1 Tax=Nanhaiella sioensis TaxID=3115293 RepID=UPI0039799B73